MVIWTKHFTRFVSYSQTAIPATPPTRSPSSNGGGGVSGGSTGGSLKNVTDYIIDNGKANCTISVERSIASTPTLSIMTTTLSNLGGTECDLYDFLMSDTVPSNFAAITEINFTPAYSTREGWAVGFSFPSFAGGESKTVAYAVDSWVAPSRVKNFTSLALSARKDVAAPAPVVTPKPAQNATKPPEPAKPKPPAAVQPAPEPVAVGPEPEVSEASKTDFVLYTCGGVLVVLIVVVIIYLFIKRKRKHHHGLSDI
jgi:hypothetical protein